MILKFVVKHPVQNITNFNKSLTSMGSNATTSSLNI